MPAITFSVSGARSLVEQANEVDFSKPLDQADRELLEDVITALDAAADWVEAIESPDTWVVRRHGNPDVQVHAQRVRLGEHHVELLQGTDVVYAGPTPATDVRRLDRETKPAAAFHPVSGLRSAAHADTVQLHPEGTSL